MGLVSALAGRHIANVMSRSGDFFLTAWRTLTDRSAANTASTAAQPARHAGLDETQSTTIGMAATRPIRAALQVSRSSETRGRRHTMSKAYGDLRPTVIAPASHEDTGTVS